MDRTTVRLILLVIGILVIAGIYAWGRYKQQIAERLRESGMDDEAEAPQRHPHTNIPVPPSNLDFDNIEVRPVAERREPTFDTDDFDDKEFALFGEQNKAQPEPPPRTEPRVETREPPRESASGNQGVGAPILIQLSVVAPRGEVFGGLDLRDTLLDLDLVHGEMGIFHRYDRDFREPLFSVASMVKPGTFPIEQMERFQCPGVVLFFQPANVSDPLSVFDDLATTCHELAVRLGGTEWDENRQPLTHSKLEQLRAQLAEACETL